MTSTMIFAVSVIMVATAFLSGIFGMAGGLILMGLLLALLPVPEAMALHAVTQFASNGWRGVLWVRHVRWPTFAAYVLGCALALGVWMLWRYIPSKPVAFLLLGLSPFMIRLVPKTLRPDPERASHGVAYGAICQTLMLFAGVAGPLMDTFFLGGRLDRRQIVATKAACQCTGHAAKFIYFGSMISDASALDPLMLGLAVVASIAGTSLARPVLERLSDLQFRTWANRIITAAALVYLVQAGYLLLGPGTGPTESSIAAER